MPLARALKKQEFVHSTDTQRGSQGKVGYEYCPHLKSARPQCIRPRACRALSPAEPSGLKWERRVIYRSVELGHAPLSSSTGADSVLHPQAIKKSFDTLIRVRIPPIIRPLRGEVKGKAGSVLHPQAIKKTFQTCSHLFSRSGHIICAGDIQGGITPCA